MFEYILKKHGLNPQTDLAMDQSISFGLTAAAFPSSGADYTVEFEPYATSLEMEGKGYVVSSLGEESGYVPYTAYSAKKSYLEANPEIIQKFTNAIQQGLDYVNSHTPEKSPRPFIPNLKKLISPPLPVLSNVIRIKIPGRGIPFSRRKASIFSRIFWMKEANFPPGFLMKIWLLRNFPRKPFVKAEFKFSPYGSRKSSAGV